MLEPNHNPVAVYVSQAGVSNLNIALENSVWGFKDARLAEEIQAGQIFLLITGFKNANPEIYSFPRCPVEDVDGHASKAIVAQIISDVTEEHSQVWPDDVYPHRFHFSVITEFEDIEIKYEGPHSLGWAIQKSANDKGAARGFGLSCFKPVEVLFEDLLREYQEELEDEFELSTETSAGLTKTRAAFWSDYVHRNPTHKDKFGKAHRTSNRWHMLPDLGLIISLYPRFKNLQIQSSGLFVRGLEEADALDVANKLEGSKSKIMEELSTDHYWNGEQAGHFFSKVHTCPEGDTGCWNNHLDWLANQADLYERVLRKHLG